MPALDVLALLPRLYGLNPRLAAHVLRLWTLEALLRAKLLPAPAAGGGGGSLGVPRDAVLRRHQRGSGGPNAQRANVRTLTTSS